MSKSQDASPAGTIPKLLAQHADLLRQEEAFAAVIESFGRGYVPIADNSRLSAMSDRRQETAERVMTTPPATASDALAIAVLIREGIADLDDGYPFAGQLLEASANLISYLTAMSGTNAEALGLTVYTELHPRIDPMTDAERFAFWREIVLKNEHRFSARAS